MARAVDRSGINSIDLYLEHAYGGRINFIGEYEGIVYVDIIIGQPGPTRG